MCNTAPKKPSRIPSLSKRQQQQQRGTWPQLWDAFSSPGAPSSPPHTPRCSADTLPPPRGHRGARLSLAEKREWQEEREWGGEGEEAEEKNKGAAQPCVTNNRRSAAAALSTPAPAVVAWLLPLKWEAFERHLNFVLLVPWSIDGKEPGGLVLVYHDSCSKAGCHNRVPAWTAALLQRYVQMLGYWAPQFSESAAEDHSPDDFDSLLEESGDKCVSVHHPHTRRDFDAHLIRRSMSFCHLLGESIPSLRAPVIGRPDMPH